MDFCPLVVSFSQGCPVFVVRRAATRIAVILMPECVRTWLRLWSHALRVTLDWLINIAWLERVLNVIFVVDWLFLVNFETALCDVVAFRNLLAWCGLLLMSWPRCRLSALFCDPRQYERVVRLLGVTRVASQRVWRNFVVLVSCLSKSFLLRPLLNKLLRLVHLVLLQWIWAFLLQLLCLCKLSFDLLLHFDFSLTHIKDIVGYLAQICHTKAFSALCLCSSKHLSIPLFLHCLLQCLILLFPRQEFVLGRLLLCKPCFGSFLLFSWAINYLVDNRHVDHSFLRAMAKLTFYSHAYANLTRSFLTLFTHKRALRLAVISRFLCDKLIQLLVTHQNWRLHLAQLWSRLWPTLFIS